MKIKKELMDILVCPVDKGTLKNHEKENYLECQVCRRKYPVKNGIPVMIAEDSLNSKQMDEQKPKETDVRKK